jgi:histidine ammonia-lyase
VAVTAQPTTLALDLDGQSLSIDQVVEFARRRGTATLSAGAAGRVEAARRLRRDLVDREIPIYGVTTGFGDSANRQIAPSRAAQLQRDVVLHLGAGTGPTASPRGAQACEWN